MEEDKNKKAEAQLNDDELDNVNGGKIRIPDSYFSRMPDTTPPDLGGAPLPFPEPIG